MNDMKIQNCKQALTEAYDKLNEDSYASAYYSCFLHLMYIPDNMFYLSCSNDKCQKKVQPSGNGYECLKCNITIN